jgi:predicted RNA binding protein YcfA (HicA-like mRNA interferase family)
MSRRLPATTGQGVLRALLRAGFHVHHVKGSHYSLRPP